MPLILDDAAMGADGLPAAMETDDLTGAMPVEMDDVDLFGDPVLSEAVAHLGLASRAHSHQLVKRVDELRGRGCCQSV